MNVFVVWAKYDDNIHGFILDRDMKGIETQKLEVNYHLEHQ